MTVNSLMKTFCLYMQLLPELNIFLTNEIVLFFIAYRNIKEHDSSMIIQIKHE